MEFKLSILLILGAGILGVVLGYFTRIIIAVYKKNSIETDIKEMSQKAEEASKKMILDAEQKAAEILKSTREDIREKEDKQKKTEERLNKKEDLLDKRQSDIERDVEELKKKAEDIKNIKERADNLEKSKKTELEKIAKLTEEEAKMQILAEAEKSQEESIISRVNKLERTGLDTLEQKAKNILATTIQRLAASVTADMFTTHVPIESEEVKGKIIGKEGRNIKAFERETGVEVIVDDSPNSITISSYDPIRRQVARLALENLIKEGRIQPAKIEKEVEDAKKEINNIIKKKGEDAVFECGIANLDPRIVSILGRLHFRTSYGQNVLAHSIEMSHIAGMLAEELGANVLVAKTGALVHDIGKALDHETEGTHVNIGIRILEKFGASIDVIKAMRAHHEEYPYETIESIIVQTADAISGARPGARKDSIENYIKRLQDLEAIANGFAGVEKSYALAAGREIRVFVFPSELGDVESLKLAENIAKKVEQDLRYPGEIKVTVIRELRAVEYAR